MEDVLQPKPEETSSNMGMTDPVVANFIKLHDQYKTNSERLKKLEDISNDYEELEFFGRSGKTAGAGELRPGAFYKILRVYDTEAKGIPKVKPISERSSLTTLSIVDSAKTQIWSDGGVQDVWDDVRKRFKAEGTAIVQLGYDSKGDCVPMECCELAEVYFDASLQFIATDSKRTGKTIRTIIRDVKTDYGTIKTMYPDLWETVNPGSVHGEETREVFNKTTESEGLDDIDVTLTYAYSIEDSENPRMYVYAGSNAAILEKHEGKDYPFFKKDKVGKDVPFLPFVEFHASDVRRGFYSPSVIGLMRDKTSKLTKVLFSSFPVFEKMVNPIMLLLGSNQDLMEEMSLARELQEMGESHIIPVQEQAAIQTVAPQSVFGEVEQARTLILRELSGVFGFNVQELEEVEQSATEFVGKTKAELKAIAGIYKLNTLGWTKLADYCVALAAKHWKNNDRRLIKFQDNAGEEGEIEFNIAIFELREWRGHFEVETDLKMPMSTQDKAAAVNEIQQLIISLAYTVPFSSMEEVDLRVETIHQMASLRDLDHIYTKPKVKEVFELVLAGQAQQTTDILPPEVEGEEPTDDVKAELAPQTALAEAGLTPR